MERNSKFPEQYYHFRKALVDKYSLTKFPSTLEKHSDALSAAKLLLSEHDPSWKSYIGDLRKVNRKDTRVGIFESKVDPSSIRLDDEAGLLLNYKAFTASGKKTYEIDDRFTDPIDQYYLNLQIERDKINLLNDIKKKISIDTFFVENPVNKDDNLSLPSDKAKAYGTSSKSFQHCGWYVTVFRNDRIFNVEILSVYENKKASKAKLLSEDLRFVTAYFSLEVEETWSETCFYYELYKDSQKELLSIHAEDLMFKLEANLDSIPNLEYQHYSLMAKTFSLLCPIIENRYRSNGSSLRNTQLPRTAAELRGMISPLTTIDRSKLFYILLQQDVNDLNDELIGQSLVLDLSPYMQYHLLSQLFSRESRVSVIDHNENMLIENEERNFEYQFDHDETQDILDFYVEPDDVELGDGVNFEGPSMDEKLRYFVHAHGFLNDTPKFVIFITAIDYFQNGQQPGKDDYITFPIGTPVVLEDNLLGLNSPISPNPGVTLPSTAVLTHPAQLKISKVSHNLIHDNEYVNPITELYLTSEEDEYKIGIQENHIVKVVTICNCQNPNNHDPLHIKDRKN